MGQLISSSNGSQEVPQRLIELVRLLHVRHMTRIFHDDQSRVANVSLHEFGVGNGGEFVLGPDDDERWQLEPGKNRQVILPLRTNAKSIRRALGWAALHHEQDLRGEPCVL